MYEHLHAERRGVNSCKRVCIWCMNAECCDVNGCTSTLKFHKVKRAIVSLNNFFADDCVITVFRGVSKLQEGCVQFDWYNDVNQPLCDCDGDLQSEFTLISWC